MMKALYKPIDNAPLVIFRIFFGFLLAAETFGAILTGWVKNNLIDLTYTFPHIGFEWLHPLPGNGMYFYFIIMGILGINVMIGYKYKWSLGLFTLLWSTVYLMQKASYNNHYYLLIVVCVIMLFLPANQYASVDVKQKPGIKSLSMPQWCSWIMILQISIVYFFATVSKFYPDWLNGTFTRNLFIDKTNFPIVGSLFSKEWFYLFIAYSGIAFDLFIVPLLLYKRTRTIAFFASLIFHLFNACILQIGIFPFFALSFSLFFYPPEKIRQWFLKKKPVLPDTETAQNNPLPLYFFIIFFLVQIVLPLRHYLIKGDVLWTEEGHRLSWRMMLRSRNGYATFKVTDKKTNEVLPYQLEMILTPRQINFAATRPDGIWQMAQYIKQEYAQKGHDVSIHVESYVSINGAPYKAFSDPTVDFAQAKWNYFFHNDWILLYE
ncbi:HTTM domain-containing protein [Flavobacterium sp. '19STA2R22 D10 B1']|uniref:HTTM domain-containing protein n=1 Tax=Flavobacterium aerium TaxID=3037261 RepID=UPI00278C7223|nr:HTTM domain-containing protein [Flavobacterium sp. '19STA2R22 D10 B1']